MDNFFKHYPLTYYGNTVSTTVAVNIFAKIAFQKAIKNQFEVYHPYTITEGDRPDTIADLYYGDPGYDWIVLYSNDIVDPYYDWYMPENSFKEFVADKYGSLTNARRNIKFYRSNYINDDSMIDVSAYDALSENQKRFWSPITTGNNRIIKYERKKEDVVYETNQTKQLTISLVGDKVFSDGEYVFQQSGGTTVSSGMLKYSNTTTAVISSITGTLSTSYNLKGASSLANSTVSAVTNISTSIAADVQNYFVPVSFYEYETEVNEKKKTIKLIDASYVDQIVEQFKNLLTS